MNKKQIWKKPQKWQIFMQNLLWCTECSKHGVRLKWWNTVLRLNFQQHLLQRWIDVHVLNRFRTFSRMFLRLIDAFWGCFYILASFLAIRYNYFMKTTPDNHFWIKLKQIHWIFRLEVWIIVSLLNLTNVQMTHLLTLYSKSIFQPIKIVIPFLTGHHGNEIRKWTDLFCFSAKLRLNFK